MEGQGGRPSLDPLQPPRPWAAATAGGRGEGSCRLPIQDWVLAPRALSDTDPPPRSHSRFTLQRQPNPTDLELSTVTPGRHIQPAEERRQPQGRALATGPASALQDDPDTQPGICQRGHRDGQKPGHWAGAQEVAWETARASGCRESGQ